MSGKVSGIKAYLFAALCSAFFLSGFAGLVYEVLWSRLLTLTFGHTNAAVAAVLTAYMAGLSIGSYFGGRIADRISASRLIAFYAVLEVLTAATAVLTRPAIGLSQSFILKLGVVSLPLFWQTVVWFSISLLLLIVPTVLMGGTLPVLVKSLMRHQLSEKPARAAGMLYGINTLGAVAGTATAGFFLVPAIGLSYSFLFAAAMSLLSALVAWGASRLFSPGTAEAAAVQPGVPVSEDVAAGPASRRNLGMGITVLALLGFAAMLSEVAWTRAFALILGSSTYAFTIMLVTFLTGFSLGSMSFSAVSRALKPSTGGLAAVLASLAVLLLAYQPFFNRIPYFLMKLMPLAGQSMLSLHAVQIALCASVMLIPTFLMGALLPWVLSVVDPSGERTGSVTGYCYSANTLGNIAGSSFAGLFLVPYVGAEETLVIAALVYAAAAIAAFFWMGSGTRMMRIILSGAFSGLLFACIALFARWDPYIMAQGFYRFTNPDPSLTSSYANFKRKAHDTCQLAYYRDGFSGTIAVFIDPFGERSILINGKPEASSSIEWDMPTQLLSSYLPVLIHGGTPKTALVVGLGSGITAGAVAAVEGMERVECVEIEPSLEETARFFEVESHGALTNPRMRIIYADARHYMAAGRRRYDIIISEPSNPWISGISNLFTMEAFEIAKSRLTDDGVFCQWFHSYNMGDEDFRMVMKTFSTVFPHVMLLNTTNADYLLIGSLSPLRMDHERIARRIEHDPVMRKDLELFGVGDPLAVLVAAYMLGDEEFRAYAGNAPLHFDDRPTLEFSAPRFLYRSQHMLIRKNLLAHHKTLEPRDIGMSGIPGADRAAAYNSAGEHYYRYDDVIWAGRFFALALAQSPRDPRTWTNLGRIYMKCGLGGNAESSFRQALEFDPGYLQAWYRLALLYVAGDRYDKAEDSLRRGLSVMTGRHEKTLYEGLRRLREGNKIAALERFSELIVVARHDQELNDTLRKLFAACR